MADALPRRRTMVGADLARGLLAGCLGAALLSGWFWLPAVLAVVFANAFLSLTFEGALQALIPTMAGARAWRGSTGGCRRPAWAARWPGPRSAASCWPPPHVRRLRS